MSVFCQFAGMLGPTALACDSKTGNLYVARFDFGACCDEGSIVVLSPKGVELRTLSVPAPEVTGLVIEKPENAIETGPVSLLVTEATTQALYRIVDEA